MKPSRPAPQFFSRCPSNSPSCVAAESFAYAVAPRPVFLAAWRFSAALPHAATMNTRRCCGVCGREVRKAGRGASRLSRVLPRQRFARGTLQKRIAAFLILRFTRRMIRALIAGSKLCADKPRHTQVRRLSAACLRSTWQEEGQALPVASPPVCRTRHVKTLPVSTPSGLRGAASRSWRLRP